MLHLLGNRATAIAHHRRSLSREVVARRGQQQHAGGDNGAATAIRSALERGAERGLTFEPDPDEFDLLVEDFWDLAGQLGA